MSSKYKVVEVVDSHLQKEFLNFPQDVIYKNDPNYIRPLDNEVDAVFDKSKNRLLAQGSSIVRFLLKDSFGNTVGRIAAFVNEKNAYLNNQPTGGVGFFECINDKEAASTLFSSAEGWLREKGMQAMDGPINLGSRDKFWGLLVDGFTPPSYGMNYNPPYYKNLFEAYGFKNYFNQYSFLRSVSMEGVSPSIVEKAERIFRNPDYKFAHSSKNNLDKLAHDFLTIYNESWISHSGIEPMTEEMAKGFVKELKQVIDDRLIIFAYYHNRPIGFYIQIPEINQVIKHLNGKFGVWEKIKFLYLLKVKKVCNRALGLVFGIVPDFRGKGIEGAFAMKFAEVALSPDFPYKDLDLAWVGDFNPVMIRFQNQLGGKVHKTHVTYRLLFDREKQENEFERCPRNKMN